jgi:hypothetical protein
MGVLSNPDNPCPPEILARQVALTVPYVDFDGHHKEGVIEVDKDAAKDVAAFFTLALKLKFPIGRVLPASRPDYKWDDEKLMADNITSGFNYRIVAGSGRISPHAYGRAFDVNTRLNPCIRNEKGRTFVNGKVVDVPSDSLWNKSKPGTLYAGHPLVKLMEERGWEWGGRWTAEQDGMVDYQHFQKPK